MTTLRHAPWIALALALARPAAAEEVAITLLHANDVYEIEPVEGGASGGVARLATLRRQLARRNPNTFPVTAGDLFSPSALGTAVVDGKPMAGAQPIDALHAAGLDYGRRAGPPRGSGRRLTRRARGGRRAGWVRFEA